MVPFFMVHEKKTNEEDEEEEETWSLPELAVVEMDRTKKISTYLFAVIAGAYKVNYVGPE